MVTEPKASRVEEPQPKLLLDQGRGEPLTAAAYATAGGQAVTYLPGNGWTDARPAVPKDCRRPGR
ncbi:hypothetical protein [Nonomuraea sp. NPDC001699]